MDQRFSLKAMQKGECVLRLKMFPQGFQYLYEDVAFSLAEDFPC